MATGLTVELPAGSIHLLADRAAYLPQQGLLLIADAHLGKSQSFRQLGVPVPAGTTASDLQRLSQLIQTTAPRELVFLGDMLHAKTGRSADLLDSVSTWRAQHRLLRMRLVRGNHDHRAGDPPADWRIDVVNEPWRTGNWALCHHPQALDGSYVLAGHEHPCVVLGTGRQRLRLPCFHFARQWGVLPAFGGFTGMHRVRPQVGDRIAAVVQAEVRLLP